MAETVMDPGTEEEKQPLQSEGAEQREGEETPPKEPDFCLEILPLIKEAQNQHGLRHGDYQRYRMYCTRRLRRIRKSLHFTQGHRSRYHKKTISVATITDVRFLYIPLVCAERAWALGMELKQAANTEHRKRFHLMRRLQRAVKHASELVQLCEGSERCDARTRLEAQFVTKYGSIISFKFLFRSGAEMSEQRDYCFVEYFTREEAERAKAALDKKKVLGKRIIVDWAKTDLGATKKNPNAVSETWDASSVSETLDGGISTSAKIAALEAKLRQMEEEDVGVAVGVATKKPRISSSRPTGQTKRHITGQQSTNSVRRVVKPSQRTNRSHYPLI